MAWLNNPPFSFDEAVQRGYDVFEVLYRDWGLNLGANVDAWPPIGLLSIPNSVAGIAIAPRSTVDRAWLTYNLLNKPPPPGIGTGAGGISQPGIVIPPNLDQFTCRIRQLSLDAPLLFTQTAQQGAGTTSPLLPDFEFSTMLVNGSMYVWPQSDLPANGGGTQGPFDIYVPMASTTAYNTYTDINGVGRALGPDVGSDVTNNGWVGPLLHLYFYLKAPLVQPSSKRAPLKAGSVVNTTVLQNHEVCVAQIATFGRRSVRVAIKADQIVNARVGALRSSNVILGGPVEEPVDTINALAANTPAVTACTQGDMYADYITIYVTPTAGANPNVTWSVSAYD